MQDLVYELPRIHLPRRSVNMGAQSYPRSWIIPRDL
jgi:hypothetical protein